MSSRHSGSCPFLLFLLLSFASLLAFFEPALAWDGVLLRVVDGDTLLVAPKNAKKPEQAALGVRLYGIDAPELHQPGGRESRAALEALAAPGAELEIIPVESDRYDRTVGLVLLEGMLLNLEQVRNGQARVYEKYCRARFCREWQKQENVNNE